MEAAPKPHVEEVHEVRVGDGGCCVALCSTIVGFGHPPNSSARSSTRAIHSALPSNPPLDSLTVTPSMKSHRIARVKLENVLITPLWVGVGSGRHSALERSA